MRTTLIFASIILCIGASAQTQKEIAQKVNRPMPTPELMATRAQLERLAASPTADWLTTYYLAYADIELSFRMEDVNQKMHYIDEAQAYIDKINGGDRSEVETLRGYSYFALMAIDPGVNGPRYANDIIACYEKALKANPNNPRAILLNAIFRNSMAKYTGSRYGKLDEDISRSRELFASQDTTSAMPFWGSNFLKQ